MAAHRALVGLPEEVQDVLLSKLPLGELVRWASTCKSNAQHLNRALSKELRVSSEDILGHKTGEGRERAKRSFFIEFLSKHAAPIRKVHIEWGSGDDFSPNNERLCGQGFRSSADKTCSICKNELCLADSMDYAVLPSVDDVFVRANIPPEALPLRIFPQVKVLHLEIPWIGRDKLGSLSPAQLAQLESITLCGCFGGHLPIDLSELKAAPVLREVTLLRNMDGHGSLSWLGDLSGFRSAQELRLGTNDELHKGDRLKITRDTVKQKEKVEAFLGGGVGQVGDGACSSEARRPARSITLLVPDLPEKPGDRFDLWGYLPGVLAEQYEKMHAEAVQIKKEAVQLARSYGWKVDEE